MILDSKNKEGHEVSTLDNLEQDTVDKNPENDQVVPKQSNPPGTIHDGTKPGKCAPKAKSKTLCTQPVSLSDSDSVSSRMERSMFSTEQFIVHSCSKSFGNFVDVVSSSTGIILHELYVTSASRKTGGKTSYDIRL
jgi:hypothetical protein